MSSLATFYARFESRTLRAVQRGFEWAFDHAGDGQPGRLPPEYLSERLSIITRILDSRDGTEAGIHYIDRRKARPVRKWRGAQS